MNAPRCSLMLLATVLMACPDGSPDGDPTPTSPLTTASPTTGSIDPTPTPTHTAEEATPSATPSEAPTATQAPTPTVEPTQAPTPTASTDADQDGVPAADDCDDTNANIYPGAVEVCAAAGADPVDEDCDGRADDDDDDVSGATTWYLDVDEDGYGITLITLTQCQKPDFYVSTAGDCDDNNSAFYPGAPEEDCDDPNDYNCDGSVGYDDNDGDGYAACDEGGSGDCDDTNAAINPGAIEVCEGDGAEPVDNDCDGLADDEDPSVQGGSTFFADSDGDGYGAGDATVSACVQPDDTATNGDDCDDADAAINPATVWYLDRDEDTFGDPLFSLTQCNFPDGYVLVAGDCDDTSGDYNPNALEPDCTDPEDYNCDGQVAYGDADGDGVADCQDCGADDAAIYPGAAEICDGKDNDCDGAADLDDPDLTGQNTYYPDDDGDGYGDGDSPVEACTQPDGTVLNGDDCDDSDAGQNPDTVWYLDRDADGFGGGDVTVTQCQAPPSHALAQGDCDDLNANFYPGAPEESCDDPNDYNCDGSVAFDDADGDGFAACDTSGNGDCNDADAAINPGADEICDGIDNDCDGAIDDDDSGTTGGSIFYADTDGDGYGDPAEPTLACQASDGLASNQLDCDDSDASLNPETVWHLDADGDGFGGQATTLTSCARPSPLYVLGDTDCDDSRVDVYPDAPEGCDDTTDFNCDGAVDNDGDSDGYANAACGGTDCDDSDPDVKPEPGAGCALGTSCLDILGGPYDAGDGVYTIDADGYGAGEPPFDVYCDMNTDGGGWTLVQRTVWEWSDSQQLMTGYGPWYTQVIGDPAPGNAFRMGGYYWERINSAQEAMLVNEVRTTDGGACLPLYYTANGVSFSFTANSVEPAVVNTASTSVRIFNGSSLSTTDSGPSQACPNSHDAVPWFYGSCCTTCPTFKGGYWEDEPHPMQNYTDDIRDLFGNLETDVCGASIVQLQTLGGTSYRGVDEMSFFIR